MPNGSNRRYINPCMDKPARQVIKELITKDMIIATIIERYPATEKVFVKYFGTGCSTCPGSKNEDVQFGAMMHNVDMDAVIKELNQTVQKRK